MKKIYQNIKQFISFQIVTETLYIFVSSFLSGGIGFLFWFFANKYYSEVVIGYATVIISIGLFCVHFTNFGIDQIITRYYTDSNYSQEKLFNTSVTWILTIGTIVSLIGTVFAFLTLHEKTSLNLSIVFFSILLITEGMLFSMLADSIMTALKISINRIWKSLIVGAFKILLLALLSLFSSPFIIIVNIYFPPLIISTVVLIILSRKYLLSNFKLQIHIEYLRKLSKYGFFNYIAKTLEKLPNSIISVIIISSVGPEYSSYYFIINTILNFVYIIPLAISTSLLVQRASSKFSSRKILFYSTVLITFIIVFLNIFKKYILIIFGVNYFIYGSRYFSILLIAALPYLYGSIFDAHLREIEHSEIIGIKSLSFFLLYIFIVLMFKKITGINLEKIGLSFLISHTISLVISFFIYSFMIKKVSLFKKKDRNL